MKIIDKISIVGLFLFMWTGIMAQSLGTITGIVKDQETGKPLQHVEVFIRHLKLGGVSNSHGAFIIKNVPAGKHTVEAKLLGYFPKRMENVQVKAGVTTILNIKMGMTSTTFNEVEILATKISQTVRTISSPVYLIDKKSLDAKGIEDFLVNGVIYQTFTGCQLYDMESRIVGNFVEKMGISTLFIESDYNPDDFGQLTTRLEAFLDSLKNKK